MPRPLRLISEYPKVLFDICQAACETPGGFDLFFPTSHDAIKFRMQLYNFRRALLRAIEAGEIQEHIQWMRDISQITVTITKIPAGATLHATTLQSYYSGIERQMQDLSSQLSPRNPINIEQLAHEQSQRLFAIQQSTSDSEAFSDPEEPHENSHEEAILRFLESHEESTHVDEDTIK